MKNPYIVRRNKFLDTTVQSFSDLMIKTSSNTGNLFFADALERQIDKESLIRGNLHNIDRVKDKVDSIVIPAANWLKPGNNFLGNYAAAIEKTDLPCVVVGLGAQSLDMATPPKLNEGTQRFLKVISERSKQIGVRGELSAETVRRYGIQNVTVTGCPSLFWSLKAHIHIDHCKNRASELKIATNASRKRKIRAQLNEKKLSIERQLYLETLYRNDSFFVAQTEMCEIEIALSGSYAHANDEERLQFEDFVGVAPEMLSAEKFRVFDDIANWVDALSTVDMTIGTRLHGCIMALMANKPAFLITIDARTQELAEFLRLPHCTVQSMPDNLCIEKIYDEYDSSELVSNYPDLLARYREFLENNGLTVNF